MSYFKVTTAADGLPFYAWADNADHAVRKVGDFAGENTVNGKSLYRAAPCAAPDPGEWVIDEPSETEAKRNAEEEM